VVSAHVLPTERKPAFFSVIAASVFNRSRKTAEPGHNRHVAGVELVDHAAKLHPELDPENETGG
jgi:hypothetical protein